MALATAIKKRIPVEVEGGEVVVFICRTPTAKELSGFLQARFSAKRNRVESRVYEARPAFIDLIALDIENAEFQTAAGESLPLNAATVLADTDKAYWAAQLGVPIASWKDLVPLSWKSSAAQAFEDSANEPEDPEAAGKN